MPTVSNKRKGEAAHTNIINYITSDPFGDINQRRSTLCCKQTSCMENSPIGGIASQMWLRPLYRLAVVQNVQGTVRRSTTSALQAASENERAPKNKPNTSSLLSDISHRRYNCYHTSLLSPLLLSDIINRRHHCYQTSLLSLLSYIVFIRHRQNLAAIFNSPLSIF